MPSKSPRKIIYGTDFFRKLEIPNSNDTITIIYWDLWIIIILVNKFENNWDELLESLRSKKKENFYLIEPFEAISNHIRFLRQKISEIQLNPTDILVGEDVSFIKKQETKAKRKILEMTFQCKEKSNWMVNTPKKLRRNQAMRGHWNLFPKDPLQYARSLERYYKSSGFYSENQSFGLEEILSKYINKNGTHISLSDLFASYRAFLTVVIEKMDIVDDSYGVIGDLYQEVFKEYYQLDQTKLEMQPKDFYLDLIELIIWEDYGFIDISI